MRPNWKTSATGKRIEAKFQEGWKGTVKELSQVVHCHKVTAGEYIRQMREEDLIYISGWVRSFRGNPSAIYAWGKHKDAAVPAPLTNAQISSRYFENLCKKVGYNQARMIKNAMRRGSTQLVIEGRVIWRKGEGVKVYEDRASVSDA